MIELCPMTLKEANAYVEQHHRTTGQWSGTSFQSDFLMGRRSWALLLWVVLWLATLTMGGHWKSIAYARTAHAMPVQCFTQPHGGRPARWDISVW